MAVESIRQKRKAKRANRRDKWGQPMSLSRKERRANRRQIPGRIFNGSLHPPGEKAPCASGPSPRRGWIYTASGSNKHH